MNDAKKYNGMEEYLQKINGQCISFSREEEMRNNVILYKIIDPLIEKMKEKDALFKQLYTKKFFGGSFYDGLKVKSPNEYDIDLLLRFPKKTKIEIQNTDIPGFIHLRLEGGIDFRKLCKIEDDYTLSLDTNKVLFWMEGLIQKAFNDMDDWICSDGNSFRMKYRKSGPAFTLLIEGKIRYEEVYIEVDLVPCFLFSGHKWPSGFRENPYAYTNDPNQGEFFVVPKKPKVYVTNVTKYWRLSFQIQERLLIRDKGRLKPALRLLKKMRDKMQYKQLSSYFLKTVVLWEVDKEKSNFWNEKSLSSTFMFLLRQLQENIQNGGIRYYWDSDYNLLDGARGDLDNLSNRLRYIINDIERNLIVNPRTIVKYILISDELRDIFPELDVSHESIKAVPRTVASHRGQQGFIRRLIVFGLYLISSYIFLRIIYKLIF